MHAYARLRKDSTVENRRSRAVSWLDQSAYVSQLLPALLEGTCMQYHAQQAMGGGSHRPLYGSMCASVSDTAGGRTPCLPQAPAVENFRHYNRLTFHFTVLSQKPKKRPPLSNSSIFYFHGVLSSHCGHLQDGASPSTVLCVLLTIDIQGCSHNCLGTLAFSNDTSCLE